MGFGKLSEEIKLGLVENLHEFTIEFKKIFGLNCFLAYGTLLGAVREKDFISHDGDMDVHYLSKYNDFHSVVQESMEIWKYYESKKRAALKSSQGQGLQMHITFSPDDNLNPEKYWSDTHIKKCTHDGTKCCHTDLFGSWINLNKTHYFSGFGSRVFACKIKDMVLPLRPFKFKGFDFYIPNKAEDLLTFQYGDWHTKNNVDWQYWPPGEIKYEISKGTLWELWINNKKNYVGLKVSSTKRYIRLNEDGTIDWDRGERLKIVNDLLGHGENVFWIKEDKFIKIFDQNKKQTDCLIKIKEDHYESKDKIMKKVKK